LFFLSLLLFKKWFNRFVNGVAPGPITNEDFACEHGGILVRVCAEIFLAIVFVIFT
jgi:hypothetical protein